MDSVWVQFVSSEPFMAFRRGDMLDCSTWPQNQWGYWVLRVVNSIHAIWQDESTITHVQMIYTEPIEIPEDQDPWAAFLE